MYGRSERNTTGEDALLGLLRGIFFFALSHMKYWFRPLFDGAASITA